MKRFLVSGEKGTSTVEFAIVLPLLLVILFGIIEFSLILYDKAMITNASREGARAGIVYHDDGAGGYAPFTEPQIQTIVNNYLANHLITFSNNAPVTTDVDPDQCPPLNPNIVRQISVTVSYPYTFFILPNFVASLVDLNLRAVTVMRCE